MEYVHSVMYRKINPSDFRNMYELAKPSSGGGQTYIELAGIDELELKKFLSLGEKTEKSSEEYRHMYTLDTYVLGSSTLEKKKLEFDPRSGRNNYRIRQQTLRKRHPAWSILNGFPEPNKDSSGKYIPDPAFSNIIDYLVIYIIRTSHNKYYAGFINEENKPVDWANHAKLDQMFQGTRRGAIFFSKEELEFKNEKDSPFGEVDIPKRVTGGRNIILYGVPGSGKSYKIEAKYCNDEERMERIVFHPDYMNTDFIGQILPTITSDELITYKFTPGPFTRILEKAWNDPESEYYLVIEELNRGNAPAIFGEVFQLLDRKNSESEYSISNHNIALEVYKNPYKPIRIPSNLSILATMNTADQNVFTLDTAFQRRWDMEMIENNVSLADHADEEILDTTITWKVFTTVINKLILESNNTTLSSEDKRLGSYYIVKQDLIDDKNNLQGSSKTNPFISSFAEKVIKYLWDDAFKFSRDKLFNKSYKSLETVINKFSEEKGIGRFKIFSDDIFNNLKSTPQISGNGNDGNE